MERDAADNPGRFYSLGTMLELARPDTQPEQDADSPFPRLMKPDGEPTRRLILAAIWLARRLWPAHPSDLRIAHFTWNKFVLVWEDYPEDEFDFYRCKKTTIKVADQKDSGAGVVDVIAAMRVYERSCTQLPMETSWMCSWTGENPFGRPFLVKSWPNGGRCLSSDFATLSHEQKMKVAKELGYRYRCVLEVKHNVAGSLAFDKEGELVVRPLHQGLDEKQVREYEQQWRFHSETQPEVRYTSSLTRAARTAEPLHAPPADATYNMLMTNAVTYLLQTRTNPLMHKLWERVCVMLHDMNAKRWFNGVEFTVSGPFDPMFIWIHDQDSNDDNIAPVRIIKSYNTSWVSLAPAFMACRPPTWLWGESEIGSDEVTRDSTGSITDAFILDGIYAGSPPRSPALTQLKDAFDAEAGPEYVKFAYTTEYQLVRRVGWLIVAEGPSWRGLKTERGRFVEQMEWILAEWQEIKHLQAPV